MFIKDSLLQIRKFDDYDENNYRVFNIAWPVEVFECAASKVIDKDLDCLAEAILSFVRIGIFNPDEIADFLLISSDLISHILLDLSNMDFINNQRKIVTEKGLKYFERTDEIFFSDKKDFGYMVRSPFDGSIMPFFIKGQLPIFGGFPEDIVKLECSDEDTTSSNKISNRDFTNAYKQYCKIYESSKNVNLDEELNYLKNKFIDIPYDEVNDDSQVKTYADVVQENDLKKAKVEILKNKGQGFYIMSKIVINKFNHNDIQMLAPFPNNITTWYNKKLSSFLEKENNIKVWVNNESIAFSDYIIGERQNIINEMPQLQYDEYDNFLITHYPEYIRTKNLKENIDTALRNYYIAVKNYQNEKNTGRYVIQDGSVLVETLLNNFVALTTSRRDIVRNMVFGHYLLETDRNVLFNKYSISDCFAKRNAGFYYEKMTDLRKGWDKGRVGNSIPERYFFLVLEAFIIGKNPFEKLIKKDGQNIVNALDFIADIRNKKSAHNDKLGVIDISKSEADSFIEKNLFLTKKMIKILAESEI